MLHITCLINKTDTMSVQTYYIVTMSTMTLCQINHKALKCKHGVRSIVWFSDTFTDLIFFFFFTMFAFHFPIEVGISVIKRLKSVLWGNANERSYTLTIPKRCFKHCSVANNIYIGGQSVCFKNSLPFTSCRCKFGQVSRINSILPPSMIGQ